MGFEAKITEPHHTLLQTFLEELPLDETEIRSGTPELKPPVDAAQLKDPKFKATFWTNPKFQKYTGWDHWGLLNKWRTDSQTTCNEFVTRCASAMGFEGTLGRFDIADLLASRGLGHCWVPADSGDTPSYGDPYRLLGPVDTKDHNKMRLNHMGVSLGVDGTNWYTAEGGQGGPSSGYDAVRRRTREWKPASLQGWVNMKALLASDKPLPFWVGGWWKIEEKPFDPYYYYFGANGKAICTLVKPSSPMAIPMDEFSMVGSFTTKGWSQIDVHWNTSDTDETLIVTSDQEKRKYAMYGKTADGKRLSGKRILLKDQFDGGNY